MALRCEIDCTPEIWRVLHPSISPPAEPDVRGRNSGACTSLEFAQPDQAWRRQQAVTTSSPLGAAERMATRRPRPERRTT